MFIPVTITKQAVPSNQDTPTWLNPGTHHAFRPFFVAGMDSSGIHGTGVRLSEAAVAANIKDLPVKQCATTSMNRWS